MRATPILAAGLAIGMLGSAWAEDTPSRPVAPREAEFFESRVRPVLIENCITCHGPKTQKLGLRLDSKTGLLKGSDDGPVVMPGDPENSPLIEAIRREGPNPMPPKKPLNAQAVADLTSWVKMGAPWPDPPATSISIASADDAWKHHWAFQPVADPPKPALRRRDWPRSSVDDYILARLEARGLTPSPDADRRTLIRRASFDLTGLPPTPEEVSAFEKDSSAEAFAKVVDRLLASPRYGERWGRYWLDVARFSDTKGYVIFEPANFPWASTYRDYVIRSFNEDKPYDQFVVEQLAADKLDLGGDRRALTAMGFLTIGGRFINNIHDILDDRIDVVTRGLLGLTVTCARCHDHKFDPIPTRDYYSLYSVFANSVEPETAPLFEDPPQTKEYEAYLRELHQRERKLADYVALKHRAVVRSSKVRAAEYLLAAQASMGQPNTEEFMLLADPDDIFPKMIERWKLFLEQTKKTHHPVFIPWHTLAALPAQDFAARAAEVCKGMRDQPASARPVNALVVQTLIAKPPRSLADVAGIYSQLLNGADALGEESARRDSLNGQGGPARPLPITAWEELRQVFLAADSPPNFHLEGFDDLLLFPDRASQAEVKKLRDAVRTWREAGPGAPPRAMALEDAPAPVEQHIFLRGNPNTQGAVVSRQFLAVIAGDQRQPFGDGSGRLELARAIVDPNNPLTARVLVNRVWMHHFGAPLVGTPSDFGLRSDPPTNPELLDHLAKTFVRSGWSIKSLHRLIVLSRTYQQASDDRPECRQIDPENTLCWRVNRRRLDFEATRDALLAVSGRLDPRIGGPSIPDIAAPSATRRTLYGFIDRINIAPLYRAFDFPDPNATSPRRDQTTVPPQALFLMNHPWIMASARELLDRREVAAEAVLESKLDCLYRIVYGRAPSESETATAKSFLGKDPQPKSTWEQYAQALILANEFVFVD